MDEEEETPEASEPSDAPEDLLLLEEPAVQVLPSGEHSSGPLPSTEIHWPTGGVEDCAAEDEIGVELFVEESEEELLESVEEELLESVDAGHFGGGVHSYKCPTPVSDVYATAVSLRNLIGFVDHPLESAHVTDLV